MPKPLVQVTAAAIGMGQAGKTPHDGDLASGGNHAVLKRAAKKTPWERASRAIGGPFLHGRAVGTRMAALPHATPQRLETSFDAAERPASCRDHGAPVVPTGGVG